ncbi:1-phosphatidylinositol 4,5-bisphosphate phosphodiesterase gamma-1 [Araneus ventricosus]|uniref:Phosphoinositide phospholipase C n=1 Tax=Araneus ventricosus TaxID=182803 RepID=A0A4Y2CW26_ARAVE|nr:1-phosphatidylinositol 4,5-bisphosphate phosphodiesterase gamma-1 [Araneus ventricosus]
MPLLPLIINKYHRTQFSRVYPKGSRIDSSNYDPIKMWNAGVQMVALNYQTADRAMQLNQARFLENGKCGYVLRPKCMFDDNFNPYDRSTLQDVEPLTLTVQVKNPIQRDAYRFSLLLAQRQSDVILPRARRLLPVCMHMENWIKKN